MGAVHRRLLDELLSTCPTPDAITRLIEVWVGDPVALWGPSLPHLQTHAAIEHYAIAAPAAALQDWRYVHAHRQVDGVEQYRVTGLLVGPRRLTCRLYGTVQFGRAIAAQLAIPIVGTTAYATALWSERSQLVVKIGSDLGFMCMVESLYPRLSLDALREAQPMELVRLYLGEVLPQQLLQAAT